MTDAYTLETDAEKVYVYFPVEKLNTDDVEHAQLVKQYQYQDETCYRNILGGVTDDGKYILSLVSKESKKELKELELALETVDCESIRNTVHRMMPVWEMLGKDCLLRDLQIILHDKKSSGDTICEHTRKIMKWLNLLIEETGKELKKYEDTDC